MRSKVTLITIGVIGVGFVIFAIALRSFKSHGGDPAMDRRTLVDNSHSPASPLIDTAQRPNPGDKQAAALAPGLQSRPYRTQLRYRVLQALTEGFTDEESIYVLVTEEAQAELLEMLRDPKEEERLSSIITALHYFVDIRKLQVTPPEVIKLCNSNDAMVREVALALASKIGDPQAEEVLIEGLAQHLDKAHSGAADMLLRASQYSKSERVATLLWKYVSTSKSLSAQKLALHSLGTMGLATYLDQVRELLTDPDRKGIAPQLRFAAEKLEVAAANDGGETLLKYLRSMRMTGEFSWYNWSLDLIVQRNLRHLAGAIRTFYEEKKGNWTSSSPGSFNVKVLHAIYKLGGSVNSEEMSLLQRSGRL